MPPVLRGATAPAEWQDPMVITGRFGAVAVHDVNSALDATRICARGQDFK
jgi:hypothetical protein